MIYKSIDTIPAKLFFKIIETEDVSLLSDERTPIEYLKVIWEGIKMEDEKNNPNSQKNKVIQTHAQIESYLAKLEFIKHAVHYLKIKEDEHLRELLKSEGYTYNSEKDLDRILLQSDGINDRIERLKLKLPKQDKIKKNVPFDELVLSMAAITDLGFIDTNKITKTQFDGLLKITDSKIKQAKSGKK